MRSDASLTPLTFDLPVGPAGMVVDPATGVVVWRPAFGDEGEQSVLLRVTDGLGGIDLQSFTVNVITGVTPTVFSSMPTGPATAGFPYRYQAAVQDANGYSLVYTLTDAPVV